MSHDSSKTGSSAPKTQLLALSEDVQVKLPRELRDIIYSYLFDIDTLKEAHKKVFPRTLAGTLALSPLPSICWPYLLRSTVSPCIINKTMCKELVEYFIQHNTNLEVHSRKCLEILFTRDLFNTGVRLSAGAIPSLAIHLGPLEYRDAEVVEAEWNRSAPLLLHGGQKFAYNFRLEVHLQTCCGAPPTGHAAPSYFSQIKDVILYLDMVYPALRKIKEQVTEKVPRGMVVFKLDFRRVFHTELVVEVREEMFDWDAPRLIYYLRSQV